MAFHSVAAETFKVWRTGSRTNPESIPASLEQAFTPIRDLDSIAADVGKGELAGLARRIGPLGGQSRKLDPKPYGTAPMLSSRRSLASVVSLSARPVGEANEPALISELARLVEDGHR